MKKRLSIVLSIVAVIVLCSTGFASNFINGVYEGFPIVKVLLNGNPLETDVPAVNLAGLREWLKNR